MRLSKEEVQKQHKNTKKLYEQGLTVAPVDVKRVLDLYNTIEALQQENEKFKSENEQLRNDNINAEMNLSHITAEYERLRAQVVRMREVLDEIANPIKYMRERAEEEGKRLDGGIVIALSESASYLKGIAEKALAEIDKAIGGNEDV